MKKELNGKSRRKFVVGGAMVFGSIALLSTGFATWVIGATVTTDNEDISVGVDTIQNQSFLFTAAVDATDGLDTLNIADNTAVSGFVSSDGEGADLTVTINVQVDRPTNDVPGQVAVRFGQNTNYVLKTALDGDFNTIRGEASSVSIKGATAAPAYTVYSNVTAGTTEWETPEGEKGAYIFKGHVDLTFTLGGTVWGVAQGSGTNEGNTIAGFYNAYYPEDTQHGSEQAWTGPTIKAAMDKIQAELDDIKDAMNGKLNVELAVGTDEGNAGSFGA